VVDLVRDYAKDQEIDVVADLDPSIKEIVVDPQTVHRSLLNLIGNGIDACLDDEDITKDWTIKIKTYIDNDNHLCIAVRDNGSGMDDDTLKKLFTPNFSSKGGKGTGLGLLVTSKLIEEHKGTIDVTSHLGQGTEFTLKLSCDAAPPRPYRTDQGGLIMNKRVVVIDDDPDVRTFVVTVLEENDLTPIVAKDGVEGLERIKAEKPDLIILDVLMPRGSGIRLYHTLMTDDDLKTIPIIMLTGIALRSFLKSQKVLAEFKGEKIPEPDVYLEKPVEPEDLEKAIRKKLGHG